MRLIFITILGALPLMAAFPQPTRVVKLDFGQQETTVVFEADSPIRKAKPLCECTKVRIEGNKLTAQVDTSEFAKPIEKQIDATTADGVTTRLTMSFEVPQAVELSAPSLIWKSGASEQPQTLRIRIPKGSPVKGLAEASISGEAFSFQAETKKHGEQYAVHVRPLTTSKNALNRLILKTDSADPRYARYIIYLSIQP